MPSKFFNTLSRTININRLTVYRILDLLVDKGLVDRINGGGRSFVYGLAPNENHPAHPHFLEELRQSGVHKSPEHERGPAAHAALVCRSD